MDYIALLSYYHSSIKESLGHLRWPNKKVDQTHTPLRHYSTSNIRHKAQNDPEEPYDQVLIGFISRVYKSRIFSQI